ncbi:MAG: ABC transporter permease [Candidatus Korarchaeum sp.]|nr:ABC transporter permease [Candidatus Korarchaeum sp.]MDW8034920.1 ABC transporter permease [Candidatus Korarchaeum sp.]
MRRDLTKFIMSRIFLILFALLGLSVLIFVLARVLPGDPARMAAGWAAPDYAVEAMRRRLGLDKPLPLQYVNWLSDVLKGDLGYSIYTRRSVTIDVMQYLPKTLELIILTEIFSIIGGLILGTIAGAFPYRLPDNIVRVLAYVAISMPAFVWAIILQLMFARAIPLFPAGGQLSPEMIPPPQITGMVMLDSLISGRLDCFLDAFHHTILPALSLSFGSMMQNARILRMGMTDIKGKDFMLLGDALGLPFRLRVLRYQLKPASIPAITAMGMSVGADLANAFLVENVYNWPGFSRYGVTAMLNKDLNAIVAVVLVVGVVYAIANFIVDLIVIWLDPRIRHGVRSS